MHETQNPDAEAPRPVNAREGAETIASTSHGLPIIQLVLAPEGCDAEIAEAVHNLRALHRSIAERGEAFPTDALKALRDTGRR